VSFRHVASITSKKPYRPTVYSSNYATAPNHRCVARVPHFTEEMTRLGYPLYFLSFLGIWKILAAVAIVNPRFPRRGIPRRLGGWCGQGVLPLVIAGAVAASWALRREGRVLHSSYSIRDATSDKPTIAGQQGQQGQHSPATQ
jgi:hypothetical protein